MLGVEVICVLKSVSLRKPQAIIGQKPADGVFREGRTVLQTIAETLFRNGADKASVNEQTGGCIGVVKV